LRLTTAGGDRSDVFLKLSTAGGDRSKVFLVVLVVFGSFTGDRDHRQVGVDAAAALTRWEEAGLIPCQSSRVGTVPSPWARLRVNMVWNSPTRGVYKDYIILGRVLLHVSINTVLQCLTLTTLPPPPLSPAYNFHCGVLSMEQLICLQILLIALTIIDCQLPC
jgi:hypothetical protein